MVCHIVTNRPNLLGGMSQFGVDRQSVHFEMECQTSKLLQQTVCWVDASFGSKCHIVGSWVDGSSRHRRDTFTKIQARGMIHSSCVGMGLLVYLGHTVILSKYMGTLLLQDQRGPPAFYISPPVMSHHPPPLGMLQPPFRWPTLRASSCWLS